MCRDMAIFVSLYGFPPVQWTALKTCQRIRAEGGPVNQVTVCIFSPLLFKNQWFFSCDKLKWSLIRFCLCYDSTYSLF